MSTYLDERAKVGDQLTFTGPNGSFFLREGQGPALLLAGGTGLAPILSILRKMRSNGSRPLHLIYGVNTDEDAVELGTLEQPRHRAGQPDLGLLCRGPGQLGGAQGLRHRASSSPSISTAATSSVYLCGPPPMVEGVRKHLDAGGVEPVGFYYERFALSGTGAAARAECPPSPRCSPNPKRRPWPPRRSPSAHRQPSKSRPS